MLSTITAILSLCLARSALATIYTTSPVASTVATGGQVLNVTWADDGTDPKVGAIGPCSVDIYVGSVTQQTWLQNLAASVDVSKTSSISSTIHPDIGESGDFYFVRFTSLGLKDPKNPQYPYQQFSAKFTINAMTGKFNSSVLAQIDSTSAASSAIPSATPSASKNVAVASASKSAAPASSSGAAGQSITTSTSLVLSFLGAATYFIM